MPTPDPPEAPESRQTPHPWLALDRLGITQALGGLALGLIALFTSYDHLTFAGRTLQLPQQWGIAFIAASVAIVVVDAELASRARDRERDRTVEARERQAQEDQRQRESLERLHQGALLSAQDQLDPTDTNRARLRAFLSLMTPWAKGDAEEP